MHHMWRYSSVARATGSYPVGRKFKSHCRYHIWPVGQAVKTPPFHGGITSSILVRVTKSSKSDDLLLFLFIKYVREAFRLPFFVDGMGICLSRCIDKLRVGDGLRTSRFAGG